LEGGGSVIGVFAPDYIKKYPSIGRGPVVLTFSPNSTNKVKYNALQHSHHIQPRFPSLNTPHLSWISEPFADADSAQLACDAINNKDITEAEKAMKINKVIKWYVGGKEQTINWAQCYDCGHWRKTPELVSDGVQWRCPGSCPSESDAE